MSISKFRISPLAYILLTFVFLSACNGKKNTDTIKTVDSTLSSELKVQDEKDSNKNQEFSENELTDKNGLIIDPAEEVITHKSKENPTHKILKNLRFGFEIEISNNWWLGVNKDSSSDGFEITIPECDAEIKVYGQNVSESTVNLIFDLCNELNDFTFKSGFSGDECINGNEHTYSLLVDDVLISIYINDLSLLNARQKLAFIDLVKTLKFSSDKQAS